MRDSYNRLGGNTNLKSSTPGVGARRGLAEPLLPSTASTHQRPSSHPSLEAAIEHFNIRGRFLQKIRFHLEKMRDLAAFNAERKVDEDRCQTYYHHACTVKQITATSYNGTPLFDHANVVADVGDNENHLIMEGLDLSHPAIEAATESSIASKEEAAAARDSLYKALRYVTVVESILEANLSRLGFMNKRLELVA
jgi:hypothetical protein